MRANHHFVVDTNVLISALLSQGSTTWRAVFEVLKTGRFLLSSETFDELVEISQQEKFDRYVSRIRRKEYVKSIFTSAILIKTKTNITACRDSKDNMLLELAIDGKADAIITGDKDLLALHPFQKIPILTPAEFLKH